MLSEQRRTQLDGIVSQMIANKETDDDIQKVVDDFSQKYSAEQAEAPAAAEDGGVLGGIGRAATAVKDATTGVVRGVAKGVASTVLGAGEAVERVGGAIGNKAFEAATGKKAPLAGEKGTVTQVREKVQPKGGAESLGFSGEQIAELFLPIPGGAKARLAGQAVEKLPVLARATGMLKAVGGEAANLAARVGLQTGGDPVETAKAAVLGGLSVPIGKAIEKVAGTVLPAVAKKIEEYNLRLTPVQRSNLGVKVGEVSDWLSSNKITGNPQQRLDKITKVYQDKEKAFQSFLSNEAKDVTVSRGKLIDQLESLKGKYANDRDSLSIDKQIDEFITTLKKRYPDTKVPLDPSNPNKGFSLNDNVPVASVNQLKRTTFEGAFNEAGTKVRDDVEFAVGDILKRNIEEVTEGLTLEGKALADFNREYGTIINARKLLKTAVGRAEIGLVGRIISSIVGGSVGTAIAGPAGGVVGTVVGQNVGQAVAGTGMRSRAASALQGLSGVPGEKTVGAVMRAIQAATQGR